MTAPLFTAVFVGWASLAMPAAALTSAVGATVASVTPPAYGPVVVYPAPPGPPPASLSNDIAGQAAGSDSEEEILARERQRNEGMRIAIVIVAVVVFLSILVMAACYRLKAPKLPSEVTMQRLKETKAANVAATSCSSTAIAVTQVEIQEP